MGFRTRLKAARPTPKVEKQEIHEEPEWSEEEFIALQDEATLYDIPIERDDGVVPYAELLSLVNAAKQSAIDEHAKHEAEKAARKAQEAAEEEAARSPRPDDLAVSSERLDALPADRLKALQKRITLPPENLVNGLGLKPPTLEDYELAAAHNYPVAIQGAKAYRIAIDMLDPLGGGERKAGGVILLIDAHTTNKSEYLTLL